MGLTVVFGGPRATRDKASEIIRAEGFSPLNRKGEPEGENNWLLPSYKNPTEALTAGFPNSGHTPGGAHPDTGAAYEPAGRASFITGYFHDLPLEEHTNVMTSADRALAAVGWEVRSSWNKDLLTLTKAEQIDYRGLHAAIEAAGS
jgi:hypothetical protein